MKKMTKYIIILLLAAGMTGCANTKGTESNNTKQESMVNGADAEGKKADGEGGNETADALAGTAHDWQRVGENTELTGNIGINIKQDESVPVCKDPVYDVLYYIGKDLYIHSIKDGVKEISVKLKASYLYSWDGELYFIASEDNNEYAGLDVKRGDICRYSPVTGEVAVICSANADEMAISNKGIYYSADTGVREYLEDGSYYVNTEYYMLEFGKSEPVQMDFMQWHKNTYLGWNKFEIDYTYGEDGMSTGLRLILPDSSEQILSNEWSASLCIYNDALYFEPVESARLRRIDLNTFEVTEYKNSKGENRAIGYVEIDGKLYTTDAVYIYCYDAYTGELIKTYSRGYKSTAPDAEYIEESLTPNRLYTDGADIYVTTGGRLYDIGKLIFLEGYIDADKKDIVYAVVPLD